MAPPLPSERKKCAIRGVTVRVFMSRKIIEVKSARILEVASDTSSSVDHVVFVDVESIFSEDKGKAGLMVNEGSAFDPLSSGSRISNRSRHP